MHLVTQVTSCLCWLRAFHHWYVYSDRYLKYLYASELLTNIASLLTWWELIECFLSRKKYFHCQLVSPNLVKITNIFFIRKKKENFQKHPDYVPSVELRKWEHEEETSSNQGKIDRMNHRLRCSSSRCILDISSTWIYHAFISWMSFCFSSSACSVVLYSRCLLSP